MFRPTVTAGFLAVVVALTTALPAEACFLRRKAPPCPCPCPCPCGTAVKETATGPGAGLYRVYCCQGNRLVHIGDTYSMLEAQSMCRRCAAGDRCMIYFGTADHQGEPCAKSAPPVVMPPK